MDAFDEMRVAQEGDEPLISPSLLNGGLGINIVAAKFPHAYCRIVKSKWKIYNGCSPVKFLGASRKSENDAWNEAAKTCGA